DGIRDRNVTGVQTCALPISRNGSRQPNSFIADSDNTLVSNVATSDPISNPAAVLAGTTLVCRPRRLSGAYSDRKAAAPPYSPPAENPCTNRNTSSKAGAR